MCMKCSILENSTVVAEWQNIFAKLHYIEVLGDPRKEGS